MGGRRFIIGTRGSRLALWQANWVKARLEEQYGGGRVDLEIIRTQGDKRTDVPLAKIGRKGLFTKEIEWALLDGRVDLAVHSMKDLPTALPKGLKIGAVTAREDVRDVLISRDGKALLELPASAKVGTGSMRRRVQLGHVRRDLVFEDLRGNLDTRLRKLWEGQFDAIVLAAAGLERMGWADAITEYISTERCLPAVGQGALGVEIRENDEEVAELVSALEDGDTRWGVMAERSFLATLGGGCQVPIGAWGRVEHGEMVLEGVVAEESGEWVVRGKCRGDRSDAERIGVVLAEELLAEGVSFLSRCSL